jgi:transposase
VIRFPATIYVATAPIDLRLSFDRLAGIVRDQLGADPRSKALYVFHNRSRTHLKMLWHDGTGYCVLYKRLDRGTYRIPLAIPAGAARVSASVREIALMLEGINEATLRAARRSVEPTRGSSSPSGQPCADPHDGYSCAHLGRDGLPALRSPSS